MRVSMSTLLTGTPESGLEDLVIKGSYPPAKKIASPPAGSSVVKSLSGQVPVLGPRKHLLIFYASSCGRHGSLARSPPCQQQAPPVICQAGAQSSPNVCLIGVSRPGAHGHPPSCQDGRARLGRPRRAG